MSRLTIAGAVCALGLAASPAAAEPFENFVDMCLKTDVDRQAAGARAKAIGWFALPVDPATADESGMEDAAIYMNVDPLNAGAKPPHDLEMLATGWGAGDQVFDVGGIGMDACVVMTAQTTGVDFAARLEELLGFAPTAFDGDRAWVFSRVGTGFRSEAALLDLTTDDPEALRRLARERKIYFAGVLIEETMTGLMVAAIRPED